MNWNVARPNLLVVTHRVPYPPDKGDRIRTYHILRFLAQYADIHLAALADEPVSAETKTVLEQLCTRVSIIPVGAGRWFNGLANFALGGTISEGMFQSSGLKKVLKAWTKETKYKGAFASSSAVANYLQIPELSKTTKVVDIVDVDSQKWFDYAAATPAPKKWLYTLEGRRLRRTEQKITKWARVAALVSSREAAMFREITDAKNVQSVTNGVDLEYYMPSETPEQASCVFVGALDYKPNVEGACWFARTVWPHVRHLHPYAKFTVVGRKPAQAVLDLAQIPGVEVVGQVPDIRPHLSQAAVVVAPLHIARGLQNKVLEAMAAGKCVVASPQALAGFGRENELPAKACNEPQEWIRTVSQLLSEPQTRRRLGFAGREYAEKYHNWNDCLEPFLHHLHLLETQLLRGGRA